MKNKRLLIVLALLVFFIQLFGFFEAINDKIFENYLIFNKQNTPSPEIVIIGIDNNTIKQMGQWSNYRSAYTKLLDILNGYPVVIGMMFSFTEETKDIEEQNLYKALKSRDNIALISKYTVKEVENLSLAIPERTIFPDIKHGHDLITHSQRGIVSSIQPFKKYPAFALLITKMYFESDIKTKNKIPAQLEELLNEIESNKTLYSTSNHILIDYQRSNDQFHHYSFIDVINGKIPASEFKDKIVLVGYTDKYNTTTFTTPFTGSIAKTSTSVELQAQIIDSLINFRNLKKCPLWLLNIITLILVIAFFFLSKGKNTLTQGLYLILFILTLVLFDYILFKYFAIWFPPATPLILILISYAISEYVTSSNVDEIVNESVDKFKIVNNLPLEKISPDIVSRVTALTKLLEIISSDRQVIKNILEGINNGIIVTDNHGKIIWVNEASKYIFSKIELINTNINELFNELDFEAIKTNISEEDSFKTELKLTHQEFLCVFNMLNSNTNHYILIFNDITEFKQIDRLKTDMVKMVSHELKNPLASIKLCAENLIFMNDSKQSVEHAKRILNVSEILIGNITNFLNISRLENNTIEVNIEITDITKVIQQSIELNKPVAEDKKVFIRFDNNDTVYKAKIDTQLFLIAMNILLSNAIKYSHPLSEVIVKVEHIDKKVCVSVIDNGIGIPKDDIDRIFEKFYRSINNKEQNIEGTGIGLTILKMILEIHNSEITVESEYKKGSTFRFLIETGE